MEEKKVSVKYYTELVNRRKSLEDELYILQKYISEDASLGIDVRSELEKEKELEGLLKKAKTDLIGLKPVKNPEDNGIIQIGSQIVIKVNDKDVRTMRLEGIAVRPGILTAGAPLGKKLLGKKQGDKVRMKDFLYEVMAVSVA